MKVFEYMAARKPIILSNTQALREIADDTSAYFISPGSVPEYVSAVQHVIAHPHEAQQKAEAAFSRVKNNTWRVRARTIVEGR